MKIIKTIVALATSALSLYALVFGVIFIAHFLFLFEGPLERHTLLTITPFRIGTYLVCMGGLISALVYVNTKAWEWRAGWI